jgi:hypothetical protein
MSFRRMMLHRNDKRETSPTEDSIKPAPRSLTD